MPPSDNNTPAPAPTPASEPPKKQGFFAKLFGGKKAAAPAVPESHESQTPPPQLDDSVDLSAPTLGDPVTPAPVEPTTPTVPEVAPAPSVGQVPSSDSAPVVPGPSSEETPVTPTPTIETPAPTEPKPEDSQSSVPPVGPTPPVQ